MLKRYPTLQYILNRGGWYILTFLAAVAINFYLPRFGTDPVDILLGNACAGKSKELCQELEKNLLTQFNLAKRAKNGGTIQARMVRIVTSENEKLVFPLGDKRITALSSSAFSIDTVIQIARKSTGRQFLDYLGQLATGDLGTSFFNYPKKVSTIIAEALPWTLSLQLPTIIFGWIIGNILGALAAYRRGVFDKVFFPLALLFQAIPVFFVGLLLVYFFAINWELFPVVGGCAAHIDRGFTWAFIGSALYHYILPFFSIFLVLAGGQAIGMRSMCIYELGADYVKYAKWLGIGENKVLFYMFRNAMLPQLTGLALSLGVMIGGALITEMIFSYPGLGMKMLKAIRNNDFPVIQGCTLIITVSVLLANFTVDILIGFSDPRVKAGQMDQ